VRGVRVDGRPADGAARGAVRPGSVQHWIEAAEPPPPGARGPAAAEPGAGLVDVVPAGAIPDGWLRVIDAEDYDGEAVSLVHADDEDLRTMAVFDAIVNNADRKGGHVLRDPWGVVCGVDHGLTFNTAHKLRTVLWGWAGVRLPEEARSACTRVAADLVEDTSLRRGLCGLLTAARSSGPRPARTPLRRPAGSRARGRTAEHPRGRRSDHVRLRALLAVPAPSRARPARTGEPVRLRTPSTGRSVPAAAGRCARLRLRDHPLRRHPLGHAATYVAFDLLHRAWLDAGLEVTYVQNVTDVDDPLLERADRDRRGLAGARRPGDALFAQDMAALSVLPPAVYLGATETIPLVVAACERMLGAGQAYRLDGDLYFDVASDPYFGEVPTWTA
jgi:hypothetical protein